MEQGIVHSFESLAAVDGAGVRCAVFFCGCPLRCAYCHNPDTWSIERGTPTDAASLAKKIARYKPYFGKDGGVTFSGGEPLLHASFLTELIPLLNQEGIGYVVDTSGGVPLTEPVKEILAGAQEILLDLKFYDDASYRRYTGIGIEPVKRTLDYLQSIGKKTRIRTVIVPAINDREEVLDAYLALIADKTCVSRYELLGFHTMGFFKYEELGIKNPLANTKPLEKSVLMRLQSYVNEQRQESKMK